MQFVHQSQHRNVQTINVPHDTLDLMLVYVAHMQVGTDERMQLAAGASRAYAWHRAPLPGQPAMRQLRLCGHCGGSQVLGPTWSEPFDAMAASGHQLHVAWPGGLTGTVAVAVQKVRHCCWQALTLCRAHGHVPASSTPVPQSCQACEHLRTNPSPSRVCICYPLAHAGITCGSVTVKDANRWQADTCAALCAINHLTQRVSQCLACLLAAGPTVACHSPAGACSLQCHQPPSAAVLHRSYAP